MRVVARVVALTCLFTLAWTYQASAQYPGYGYNPYTSMYPTPQPYLPSPSYNPAPPIQLSFYGSYGGYGGYNPTTAYAPQWPSPQPSLPPRHCQHNAPTPTQAYYSNNYYLQQPVQTPHRWHLGHFLMGPH